tara:strand:+ start:10271 stop:10660 length:390 start_codon:yes stop_codon:yes gene_type:complete
MEFKKRGNLVMPRVPIDLTFKCRIFTPMYEKNQKKYLDLELMEPSVRRIKTIHDQTSDYITKRFMNPLQGNVLKVKVPYRYNRVTCKVGGIKPTQEMQKGDNVNVHIEFCGVWEIGEYCGLSWKLSSIE